MSAAAPVGIAADVGAVAAAVVEAAVAVAGIPNEVALAFVGYFHRFFGFLIKATHDSKSASHLPLFGWRDADDFSSWASTSSSMLDCWNIVSRLA